MLVTPTVPPTPILAGVILLVLVYAVALLALLRSSERGRWSPLATAFVAQLVLGGAAALFGLLQPSATRPPLLILALLPSVLIGVFVLPALPAFRGPIERLSAEALYLPHAFRILFGGLLLALAARGGLPWQFAEPVGTGDIVAGVGAIVLYFVVRSRSSWAQPLAWLWNVFGVLDFVQAVSIGVLAASGPQHRLATTPTTDALTMFPISLIPTFAVVTLLVLHGWSARSLLRRRAGASTAIRDQSGVVAA